MTQKEITLACALASYSLEMGELNYNKGKYEEAIEFFDLAEKGYLEILQQADHEESKRCLKYLYEMLVDIYDCMGNQELMQKYQQKLAQWN